MVMVLDVDRVMFREAVLRVQPRILLNRNRAAGRAVPKISGDGVAAVGSRN